MNVQHMNVHGQRARLPVQALRCIVEQQNLMTLPHIICTLSAACRRLLCLMSGRACQNRSQLTRCQERRWYTQTDADDQLEVQLDHVSMAVECEETGFLEQQASELTAADGTAIGGKLFDSPVRVSPLNSSMRTLHACHSCQAACRYMHPGRAGNSLRCSF